MAAARAIGGVQAQALRAAGDLVERLTQMVDGADRVSDADAAGEEEAPRSESARLVDLWSEILARVSRSFDGAGSDTPRAPGRFEVDVDAGPEPGALGISWDAATGRGQAEVWLTNSSERARTDLKLTVGPLMAPSGALADATLQCDPNPIVELPARSSRGLRIEVVAPGVVPPGEYRALAQIDGTAAWFPIELRIETEPTR